MLLGGLTVTDSAYRFRASSQGEPIAQLVEQLTFNQ